MKRKSLLLLMALLPMAVLTTVTSCSKDDDIVQSPDNNSQQIPEIVVTVDANGNADGGHRFTKIDDTNFYIDDIKYTAVTGNLEVTGYDNAFFKGSATIINKLIYQGRHMNVTSITEKAFYNCKVLISITIPNSVTTIGKDAFLCCI